MAAIPQTSGAVNGFFKPSMITLSASDTLTYSGGTRQVLVIHNITAGALTPLVDGAGASAAVPIPGTGKTYDASAGTSIALAAGECAVVSLDTIPEFVKGAVTVTGGTGCKAWIATF
jgi:hypothetical protein